MTEQELQAIETGREPWGAVGKLVAEVRKLQGLIKQAEWADGARDFDSCPWCGESCPFMSTKPGVHAATCPAFPPSEAP